MFRFDPRDWYWIVGGDGPHQDEAGNYTGDETQRYSSLRDAYVPADDPTYVAWVDDMMAQMGLPDPTTRIDTGANLKAVLQAWGMTPQNTG